MKRIIFVIAGLVAIVAVGALLMNHGDSDQGEVKGETISQPEPEQKAEKQSELKFSDILADGKNGAKLYDVREPDEYAAGHFESFENYSVRLLNTGQMPDVEKDTKIYVHCRRGVRSADATYALRQAGFTNVVDLGGIADVEKIGGELIKENN
ncbi:rhodanese-like domain-containing protein [Candidatus Saccharibacteria bacterium]|nr:rhodanese-like domain-containing protein [Candidatus Saccharibacteria bacterium]